MSELLLTQEVGSLPKPDWRVLPFRDGQIDEVDITQAIFWAYKLDLDSSLVETTLRSEQENLRQFGRLTPDGAVEIKNLAAKQAVRLQEKAGLDIIYDGEQDRSEMYQDAIEKTVSFEPRGLVRVLDGRYFAKSAVVGVPSLKKPWHDDELKRLQSLTTSKIKVPITGPYTLADWSFDEYYRVVKEAGGRGLSQSEAKRQLVLDLAQYAIRPNLISLLAGGADYIQIDEPALGARPTENNLAVEAFNIATRDLLGKFSVHICFSNHQTLLPNLAGLENCWQISTELANRDSHELGRSSEARPGYASLKHFKKYVPQIALGLGVTSIHENTIESPQLVRDRILFAVDTLDDPALVYPSPDCGLRTRSIQVAFDKLRATTEGAALAKQELGL